MSKEILLSQETERKESIGAILAIVGIDDKNNGKNISNPLLWTTVEKVSKIATNKIEGQISLPADTRKIGESIMHNVIGSLAEFSDNDFLIKNALSFMPSSFTEGGIIVRGNPVDLVVMVYDGPLACPIIPLDSNEVVPNGWMLLNDLKKQDSSKLRSFMKDIIALEEGPKRPIGRVLDEYFSFEKPRMSLSTVLPYGFSMADFYMRREKLVDVAK